MTMEEWGSLRGCRYLLHDGFLEDGRTVSLLSSRCGANHSSGMT